MGKADRSVQAQNFQPFDFCQIHINAELSDFDLKHILRPNINQNPEENGKRTKTCRCTNILFEVPDVQQEIKEKSKKSNRCVPPRGETSRFP